MSEKEKVDAYLNTIDRLEKDIAMVDAGAFYASAAISLKRIADALEQQKSNPARIWFYDKAGTESVLHQVNNHDSRNVYRGEIGEVLYTEEKQ